MIESIRNKNRNWIYCIILAAVFAVIMAFTDETEALNKFIMLIWLDALILQRKIRLDIGDALVVIMTLVYCAIDNPDPAAMFWETLHMLALYQIARYFVKPSPDAKTSGGDLCECAAFAVLILSVACFLKGILNYSYFLTDGSFLAKEKWPLWDPKWTSLDFNRGDAHMRTPEEQQFYMILMGSLLPYFVMKVKDSKILGITGIVMSVIAMWIGTLSTGGLAFVCALTATIITFTVLAAGKGMFVNIRFWVITGAVIDGLTAFILLVKLNVWNIGSFISGNLWSGSDSRFYSTRFSLMGQALKLLPQYPFGGYDKRLVIPNVKITYSAYNSWIDMAVDSGILPFVFSVAFLVFNIVALVYVCRKCSGIAKYTLTAAFTGMTAYNMLQPAFFNQRYWYTEVFLGAILIVIYMTDSGKKGLELSFDSVFERFVRNDSERKADEN